MPLVISMRVGEAFCAREPGRAERRARLVSIRSAGDFTVVDDAGHHHDITDTRGTEVFPDVVVSAGREGQAGIARLAIRAPTRIKITRSP